MRAVALALLALGCTHAQSPIRVGDCAPGEVSACFCEGVRPGWQTCGADRVLGACRCADGGPVTTPPAPCDEPFARCAEECVNLLVTSAHCGRCGNACPAGQLCYAGGCVLLADAAAIGPDVPPEDVPPEDVPDASDALDP